MSIVHNYDLFYTDGKIIPFDTWISRGVFKSNYLLWRGLVHCASKVDKFGLSNRYRRVNRGYIELEVTCVSIDKVTQKEVKDAIRYKEYISIIQKGYNSMVRYTAIHGVIDINRWMEIYSLPRICDVTNRIRDLQYKIVHRFLPTQSLLYKMNKIDSPLCLYCNLYVDNLEHALFDCLVVNKFWLEVFDVWNTIANVLIDVNLYIVTFGYFESENDNDEYIPMNTIPLNALLLLGKQYIFQQKLKDCTLNLARFKFYVSTNVREEHSLLHLFAGTL
jgi:hypothetical protein